MLTSSFVSKYTNFGTADELFEASGFKIDTEEDFASIPDEEWDDFIRSVSRFDNWESMLSKAVEAWVSKKLGF